MSGPVLEGISSTMALARELSQDPELDPRIQIELEKLNSSTDVINKLEHDLDEARSKFRQLLAESTHQLDLLAKRLGSCVDKSRPYYDSRMSARIALFEAQEAASRFEKASSAHEAAKEMVALAEEGFAEKGGMQFDQAWQEMLNHATNRVNDAERERNESADEHKRKYAAYQRAEQRVNELQKSLKRAINKSRQYFETKARYNQLLDDQKRQVQVIEETIQMTKSGYAESLRELEKISEEIHEKRHREQKERAELGVRGSGVGAECPSPEKSGREEARVQSPEASGQSPGKSGSERARVQSPEKTSREEAKSQSPRKTGSGNTCPEARSQSPGKAEARSQSSGNAKTEEPSSQECSSSRSMTDDERSSNHENSKAGDKMFPKTKEENVDDVKLNQRLMGLELQTVNKPASEEDSSLESFSQDADRRLSSSSLTSSPVASPCYEQLRDDSNVTTPIVGGAIVGGACPNFLKVQDQYEDLSDSESLMSMEMLDDRTIDQLLKGEQLDQGNFLTTTSATPTNCDKS